MPIWLDLLTRLAAFALGLGLVGLTVLSAVRAFVLPRSAGDPIARLVSVSIRRLFQVRLGWAHDFRERDQIMALYAPLSLLALPPAWLTLVSLGYMGMFWATGSPTLYDAFKVSGSSLLTLGSEAVLGLILVALPISYLPTMYASFSKREALVTLLETRAGSPPSAVYMFALAYPLGRTDHFTQLWSDWERRFSELDETHPSLPAVAFFRSPHADHSWITAAGAVLDAASLYISTLDLPPNPPAALCIRAGYLALRRICGFFGIRYHPDPHFPAQPISISRAEFDLACDRLRAAGLPLKPDLDQAWIDFAGWRVNYDTTLIALCSLTMAPDAPWSSDRAAPFRVGRPRR